MGLTFWVMDKSGSREFELNNPVSLIDFQKERKEVEFNTEILK